MKKLFIAVLFSLVCLTPAASRFHGSDSNIDTGNEWQLLGIGSAAAYQRIIVDQRTGNMITASDQGGCYLWDPVSQSWENMIRLDRMPDSVIFYNGRGTTPYTAECSDARFDPRDPQKIWIQSSGRVLKSVNGGKHWDLTAYPAYYQGFHALAGNLRSQVPLIAIDPNHSNVVYVGSPDRGVKYTLDGGDNWTTQRATIGAAAPGGSTTNPYAVTSGTDSTTVATCTGTVVFNHGSATKPGVGLYVRVWQTSNPANSMYGLVSAASGTTFSLDVQDNFGTCNHSDWSIGNGNDIGGSSLVIFDQTSADTGGRTQGIYVCTYGLGVFKTTDAGANWSPTTGSPTLCKQMMMARTGTLWLMNQVESNPNLWKLTSPGGTWQRVNWPALGSASFAVDNLNCVDDAHCHIVVTGGGLMWYSEDGGATWDSITFGLVDAVEGEVGWLKFANAGFGVTPQASFGLGGRLWLGGEGPLYTTPVHGQQGPTLWTASKGTESAEIVSVAANPLAAGEVLLAVWDIGCFMKRGTLNLPARELSCYGATTNSLRHITGVEFAQASDPTYVVAVGDNQQNGGGYISFNGVSANSGKTWQPFTPPIPAACGGGCAGANVAVSTKDNWMYAVEYGAYSELPYYTLNGGRTWTQITVSGAPATINYGWPGFYGFLTKQIAADPTTPGKFYLYNWNINASNGSQAIITCTSGGASCSYTQTVLFLTDNLYNGKLKVSPAGHLFYSGGLQSSDVEPKTNPLYFSTDGAATAFQTVTGMKNVWTFGFGATFPGKSYASFYAVGWYTGTLLTGCPNNCVSSSVTSQFGTYMCKQFNSSTGACTSTWQQMGTKQYPMDWAAIYVDMDGDKVTPGLAYIGTFLSGAFYGKFD